MDPPESADRRIDSNSEEESLRPTYAPIAMAMGIAMAAWGLMAVSLNINALWFMSIAGAGLMSWALRSWIHEIVLQWTSSR